MGLVLCTGVGFSLWFVGSRGWWMSTPLCTFISTIEWLQAHFIMWILKVGSPGWCRRNDRLFFPKMIIKRFKCILLCFYEKTSHLNQERSWSPSWIFSFSHLKYLFMLINFFDNDIYMKVFMGATTLRQDAEGFNRSISAGNEGCQHACNLL